MEQRHYKPLPHSVPPDSGNREVKETYRLIGKTIWYLFCGITSLLLVVLISLAEVYYVRDSAKLLANATLY